MPDEQVKNFIDSVLNKKMSLIISKINSLKSEIETNLKNITQSDDFFTYEIPKYLETKKENIEEEKISLLHRYTLKISTSTNQINLIDNLLEGINLFCKRAALFLLRDDKFVGWAGIGFLNKNGEIGNNDVKKIFLSFSANTIFRYIINNKNKYSGKALSQPDDHLIYSRFGGEKPNKIFVSPFYVNGKPQAVIYADSFGDKEIEEKTIEILSAVGEMSLNLLPFRQKLLARVKTKEFSEEPEKEQIDLREPIHEDLFLSTKKNDPERKARVIINDLVLYNELIIDEARNSKNLYKSLQNAILQAKEEYLRKFNDVSIFEKQLVKILAKGDKEALRGYPFETLF
jgi:hypothetical protein